MLTKLAGTDSEVNQGGSWLTFQVGSFILRIMKITIVAEI